jgi:hypothetical protein
VNFLGISAPFEKLVLETVSAMALPPCASAAIAIKGETMNEIARKSLKRMEIPECIEGD